MKILNCKVPLFIGLLVFAQSCSLFSESSSPDAFLSGKIVNPLSNQIVILKDSKSIDTVSLDSLNRFKYHFKNVEKGLYTISHGKENQVFYLEPGDSTVIYANTLEFDNSLHYSGKGAEKNNFLIDMFLMNEKNNSLVLSSYKMEPTAFLEKVDSIRQSRLKHLNSLKEKHNFSEDFLALAKKGIEYEVFDLKERYTFLIHKYNPQYVEKFPSDFHDYRKNIDFDNEEMENYYGYLRLLDNYLKNRSIEKCLITDTSCKSMYSFKNIKSRLHLIDSLTDNPEIKDSYFTRLGARAITVATKQEDIETIIELLEEEKLPEEKLNNLKMIGAIQSVYLPGQIIPTTSVYNNKGVKMPFRSIVKKPTVFYNWSMYSVDYQNQVQEKIALLRKKYPQIDFVGLNIDEGESMAWMDVIRKKRFKAENEYQIITDINRDLLKFFVTKILMVDTDGKVVIGDAKLGNPDFEARLEEFLYITSGDQARMAALLQ